MSVVAVTWWDLMEVAYHVAAAVAGFLWQHHRLFELLFLIIVAVVTVWNLRAMHTLGRPGSQEDDPFPAGSTAPVRVSVLIPARDEEENIGRCVASLLRQDYADFEVIVLDDASSDGTAAVVEGLADSSDKVRLVTGRPLPAGWLGKVWGCHQLSQEADGELLLFTDADTWLHPRCLTDAVAELRRQSADLLTGLPRQETVSLLERLVIPVISWAMFCLLPVGPAQRVRVPLLSAGIGQFMLFRRVAYTAVGGHAAIRDEVVDDMALARRVKAAGLRWRFVDAVPRVSCRMYRDHRGVVEGLTKNIFPALGGNVLLALVVFAFVGFCYLEPVVLLVGWSLGADPGTSVLLWTVACMALSLWSWLVVSRRTRYPAYQALLYPVTIFIVLLIGLRSLVLTSLGRATWKGRRLTPDDTVA